MVIDSYTANWNIELVLNSVLSKGNDSALEKEPLITGTGVKRKYESVFTWKATWFESVSICLCDSLKSVQQLVAYHRMGMADYPKHLGTLH